MKTVLVMTIGAVIVGKIVRMPICGNKIEVTHSLAKTIVKNARPVFYVISAGCGCLVIALGACSVLWRSWG
ncbi:MAG TPA: hypothetical protein HPP54_10535 [Nitrospinae bacterium]|nr:hypothetical protein [Nitrospinota bacterium]